MDVLVAAVNRLSIDGRCRDVAYSPIDHLDNPIALPAASLVADIDILRELGWSQSTVVPCQHMSLEIEGDSMAFRGRGRG